MADITPDVGSWSSTAGSNQPTGTTAIGTGLDDNLRALQAGVKSLADNLSSVAGTNTITATMANIVAYTTGLVVKFIPANTNTGATTLNISSLGAKNVFNQNAACVGGELQANVPVEMVYDGTQFQILGRRKKPTRQVFTSGTAATYTTPANCTSINVRLIGGGGGGGAQSTNNGSGGTATTWSGSSLSAGGGSGGGNGGNAGGAGGTAANGDININGATGQAGTPNTSANTTPAGGQGGNGAFGGGGGGGVNAAGNAAATNSGGGGGGAGASSTTSSGAGGGSGAYVEKRFTSPAATYTYTVGPGGNGGSAGGAAGGAGAAGIIIVDEFYD